MLDARGFTTLPLRLWATGLLFHSNTLPSNTMKNAILSLPRAGESPTAPPIQPLLRLENGRHTAPIRGIATDRTGRWIVSASLDKTLRLWEATSGRLLRTFRPPIGEGNEGKLYAVAMDPQGEWIAAGGGWTGFEWERTHSLYLLARASGRLLQRLTGLEEVIDHLAVSADGQWLAACLGGKNGLRVFDAKDGFRPVFADRDYGDQSYGAAFSPDGRWLVTSSLDGQLRLYRIGAGTQDGAGVGAEGGVPRFSLLKKARLEGGNQPFGVSFHPAPGDDRIAVSFYDSTTVQVLDGGDLGPRYAADSQGLDNGSLSTVAWSADGEQLLAGGSYIEGNGCPVLAWNQGGRGARSVWSAAANTIMEIKALPTGGLAVGTADPALLVLDATGARQVALAAGIADMRDKRGDDFRLSRDGSRIAFGLGVGGKKPVWFDVGQRQFRRGPPPADSAPNKGLLPPRLAAPGLAVRSWKNQYQPELNGKALELEDYERARSLALAPDGERFLLGTDWRLLLFDRQGRHIGQRLAPGVACGVNVSGDGRLAVAAFHDGTLRWYRLADGELLLSLFISVPDPGEEEAEAGNGNANQGNSKKDHANKENAKEEYQWVLWTPSGYYDASPGGGRLIGWHVNNGKDQAADFYPASSLRKRFYRPEVVAHILDELDEGKALAKAGVEPAALTLALPPTVELLEDFAANPFTEARVRLRYRLHTRNDSPIERLLIMVDGRPFLDLGEGAVASGVAQDFSLTLPERDLDLALIAENQYGASEPATARFIWEGKPAVREGKLVTKEPPTETPEGDSPRFRVKPLLYVLAIGVSAYDNNKLDLDYANKDARDFCQVLERRGAGLYRQVVAECVTDADKKTVLAGLDWLGKEVTQKDVGVLFLSGHGANDDDGDYYFLPRDAKVGDLRYTGVPYYEFRKTLGKLKGSALAFIDTCHAGNVLGGKGRATDINAVIQDLIAPENGVVVFASSTGEQSSLEDTGVTNSVFTKALVEGLDGKAAYEGDGEITAAGLELYLGRRVRDLSDGQQTPTSAKPPNTTDFPIVVVEP